MLTANESPPGLSWFAARSLASILLRNEVDHCASEAADNLGSKDTFELTSMLPTHLRSLILHFLIRTGGTQEGTLLCLTDEMLARICRGMCILDFSHADHLGGIIEFERVRDYCPDLIKLDMSHWKRADAVAGLASGHKHLREINLSKCVSLDDEDIRNITRYSPMLEKINVSHNEFLTDEALFAIASNCPCLHSINLNCCHLVTDVGLASLLMSMEAKSANQDSDSGQNKGSDWTLPSSGCCSRLKELGIKRLVNIEKALSILLVPSEAQSAKWPHIQKLNAKSLPNVPAEIWTKLIGPCLSEMLILKLGETNLDWSAVLEKYEMLNGPLVGANADDLPLQVLDLSWNDSVDEDSVCRVLQKSPNLEVLKMRACETIGSRTVNIAAEYCPQLCKINMARCNHVSNIAVLALARSCIKLKYVNLAWSDCGSEGMLSLLQQCQDLVILNVSGCKTIIVNEIEDDVVEHPSLTYLDCSWVNAVSESIAMAWVSRRKSLKPSLKLQVVDYYNEIA